MVINSLKLQKDILFSSLINRKMSWECHLMKTNALFIIIPTPMQQYTIINLVRVWYEGLSPRERLCHPSGDTSHSYKVYNCFITSNILHSAISDNRYQVMTQIQYVYTYFHNGVWNRHVILYNYCVRLI